MAAPYNLELSENCEKCSWRAEGFFCDLPSPALKALDSAKFTSSYPSGAVLFVQGQVPRGVYLLCKGRVKLTMTSAEGKAVILRFVEPGELIGANSGISGQAYEVTAETLEPCQVNFIRREGFLQMVHKHNEVCLSMVEQISSDYSAACVQIRSLGLARTASEKVARFLLDWAGKGKETNEGIRMSLPLTHEEIAQTVGISRETVTRTLTELRSRSLISTKGPTVVIRNKAGLEALAAA